MRADISSWLAPAVRKLVAAALRMGSRQKSSGGKVEAARAVAMPQPRTWTGGWARSRARSPEVDQRHAAVVDETIVEQMQWLADVARRVIVAEGEGSAHHGRGIERCMVTKSLRDGAELIRSRPVKVHMAAGHQRM